MTKNDIRLVLFLLTNYYVTGKDQVSVGVVAVNFEHASSESSSSVYPLAIGNCKENR